MRRIGIMLLLLILLLTGCGGVSKEDYDAAVRERDALRREYIDSVTGSLRSQLDNTYLVDSQGRKTKLRKKGER